MAQHRRKERTEKQKNKNDHSKNKNLGTACLGSRSVPRAENTTRLSTHPVRLRSKGKNKTNKQTNKQKTGQDFIRSSNMVVRSLGVFCVSNPLKAIKKAQHWREKKHTHKLAIDDRSASVCKRLMMIDKNCMYYI